MEILVVELPLLLRVALQVVFFGGTPKWTSKMDCSARLAAPGLRAALQVDFLPVGGISEETTNALKASKQEAKKRTRKARACIDGVDQSFEVRAWWCRATTAAA